MDSFFSICQLLNHSYIHSHDIIANISETNEEFTLHLARANVVLQKNIPNENKIYTKDSNTDAV